MGDVYKDLVDLFKILQEKSRFIDEDHRFMSNRMLECVDFSKDIETQRIFTM